MENAQHRPRHGGHGSGSAPALRILYNDSIRQEQSRRWTELTTQVCLPQATSLREQIDVMRAELPPEMRPEAPSARILALVLGFFRTAATLKERAMNTVELSAKQIADLLHISVTQLKLALAWLGSSDIKVGGTVVAQGLGILENTTRFGHIQHHGVEKVVYRTSARSLTELGRKVLGLLAAKVLPTKLCSREDLRALRKQRCKTDFVEAIETVRENIASFLQMAFEPRPTLPYTPRSDMERSFLGLAGRVMGGDLQHRRCSS